jgi:hypothetical protein
MGAWETFFTALTDLESAGPIRDMIDGLGDGVGEDCPTLKMINERSKAELAGGDYIEFDIEKTLPTGYYFNKGSSIAVTDANRVQPCVIRSAMLGGTVEYFLSDVLKNSGPDKTRDYVALKIDQMKRGFGQMMNLQIYGNGTTDAEGTTIATNGSGPIYGIPYWIEHQAASAGSLVAGITRSSSTAYMNNWSDSLGGFTASLSTSGLLRMYAKCTHNGESPDLITCSDTTFEVIWNLSKAEKWPERKISEEKAYNLGFPRYLSFHDALIVPDKTLTASTSGGRLTTGFLDIFFINTKTFKWKVNPEADHKLGDKLEAYGTNAYCQKMWLHAQLVCTAPRMNGNIRAAAA